MGVRVCASVCVCVCVCVCLSLSLFPPCAENAEILNVPSFLSRRMRILSCFTYSVYSKESCLTGALNLSVSKPCSSIQCCLIVNSKLDFSGDWMNCFSPRVTFVVVIGPYVSNTLKQSLLCHDDLDLWLDEFHFALTEIRLSLIGGRCISSS